MITRSQSKNSEGEIVEGDPDIGSRIWLFKQIEANMAEENISTSIQK